MSGSWGEVMGWDGTWQLVGLLVSVGALFWAMWAVGYAEGRASRRNRRR
mgnify:CR=1 FL=1